MSYKIGPMQLFNLQ